MSGEPESGPKVEREVEIAADADVVWDALTKGEQIRQWFPLDARVRPGAGGAIWFSFGENMAWESPIEIWEPSRRLQVVDTTPGDPPVRLAVDYTLESRGGSTILRLVHSGFASDAWEDELDTMNAGWGSFLANLKHYLERHRGEDREVAYFRHEPVKIPRAEAFARTLRALGFAEGKAPQIGERYAVTSVTGDSFEGTVRVMAPAINLTMSVDNWNDGWMMVEMEPGRGQCRPSIWLSLYGEAKKDASLMSERIQSLLTGEFGASGLTGPL